jgi:predicted adenine nucleotide alpha hydrolase (AANH) superfamily ATPase
MKKVLLHFCCGVCASEAVARLIKDGSSVTGYFYNPNIATAEEYKKRLEAARLVAKAFAIELIEGLFDQQNWSFKVKGLEEEPEGGRRCLECYKMRLEATYNKVKEKGFDYFATTLSISPHKNSQSINEIGRLISAGQFLPYDFKKNGGFKKAMDFSKHHDLYRQGYCGCSYSQRPSRKTKDLFKQAFP